MGLEDDFTCQGKVIYLIGQCSLPGLPGVVFQTTSAFQIQ
jgi:hypothetical protein